MIPWIPVEVTNCLLKVQTSEINRHDGFAGRTLIDGTNPPARSIADRKSGISAGTTNFQTTATATATSTPTTHIAKRIQRTDLTFSDNA